MQVHAGAHCEARFCLFSLDGMIFVLVGTVLTLSPVWNRSVPSVLLVKSIHKPFMHLMLVIN